MTNSPKPYESVLVANRGEIAVRILKAVRECGLRGIAIHNDLDRDGMHLEYADSVDHLRGEDLSSTYLSPEAIINSARRTGADAIHPGYGFLSERADFAKSVLESGLVWIGPPPEAIRLMGDKIRARESMIKAQVPVIPGRSISISDGEDPLPQLAAAAAEVGYPLLLKASAGGGGKGMRVVNEPKLLRTEYQAASREATAAFGNGTVYVESLLRGARHIEIQIFADSHGNVIHLNERDCSLQRRHQKVIEEAPSPAVDPELREKMGDAAIQAARAVNYEGAGTVEFLLDRSGGFYFMEMNTRIQVEHPVTEMVTGIDLIAEQLRIAGGEPISVTQEQINLSGHAIECRINAEDASHNFRPAPGRITGWLPPGGPGVRVDSHVYTGYDIPPFYDSLIGKLIVWGRDREMALTRMKRALNECAITGIPTTVDFHLALLERPEFINGDVHTKFVEQEMLN